MKDYGYQIIAAVLGVAVLGVLAISFLGDSSEAVLRVNGDRITQDEINQRVAFSSLLGMPMGPEEVVDELITEKVLLQEANRRGIRVSDREAQEEYQLILQLNGLTEEGLIEQLAGFGVSLDYFKSYFKMNLIISQLVENVIDNVQVSAEEVNLYYVQNLAQFQQPETSVVRHILISNTQENYEVLAQDVRNQLNADLSNFCDLVEEHTQDPASIPVCGEYSVARNDPFVPEFLDASFDMSIGEVRLVESDFGIHIMVKDDLLEPRELGLEEVRANIEQFLSQSVAQGEFEQLLNELRESARIN